MFENTKKTRMESPNYKRTSTPKRLGINGTTNIIIGKIEMISKYFGSIEELSKAIDHVIEKEKEIKEQLPNHPRWTSMRIQLDQEIKNLRWLKKKALEEWREEKRNPVIKP